MGKVKAMLFEQENDYTALGEVVSEMTSLPAAEVKKSAKVISTPRGYQVLFSKEDSEVGLVTYYDKSERYAEDAAKNWVDGVFSESALNDYLKEGWTR